MNDYTLDDDNHGERDEQNDDAIQSFRPSGGKKLIYYAYYEGRGGGKMTIQGNIFLGERKNLENCIKNGKEGLKISY